jgi:hypothetical protein
VREKNVGKIIANSYHFFFFYKNGLDRAFSFISESDCHESGRQMDMSRAGDFSSDPLPLEGHAGTPGANMPLNLTHELHPSRSKERVDLFI